MKHFDFGIYLMENQISYYGKLKKKNNGSSIIENVIRVSSGTDVAFGRRNWKNKSVCIVVRNVS